MCDSTCGVRSYVISMISRNIRLLQVIQDQCHVLLDVERLLFPVTFYSYLLLIIFVLHHLMSILHFYTIYLVIYESCIFQKI